MSALNLVLGSITHSLEAMDAVTAFFATAPGGSTEMVVMSEAGANLLTWPSPARPLTDYRHMHALSLKAGCGAKQNARPDQSSAVLPQLPRGAFTMISQAS